MNLRAEIQSRMPASSLKSIVRWLWHASAGERKAIFVVSLIGILRVAAGLWFVWLSKILIDAAVNPDVSMGHISVLASVLVVTMLLDMGLWLASDYIAAPTRARLANRLRHTIYDSLLDGDLYSGRKHTGDYLNRMTIDINKVVETLVGNFPNLLVMVVQLIAAFALLCVLNPTLALCALIITPICVFASKFYVVKVRRINEEIRQDESRIQTNIQEGLQHRDVVQTLESEALMSRRLDDTQEQLYDKILRRTRIGLWSRFSVRIGFIIGYLVAFIWSVVELHTGAITFGVMTAFLQLVNRIQNPVSQLSSQIPALVTTATSVDRLMEIAPDREVEEAAEPVRIDAPAGIRITDLVFSYGVGEPEIYSGFSHDFAPGSKTVLMGETGIGKSTLIKLILALLTPQKGSIEIYNANSAVEVSRATRCNMVYVPQGNSLLDGTIRENLLMADPEATDAELIDALCIAAADFVFSLPYGLDTKCGELGTNLSEGQCQRIAIARALLRKGPIMVLDEFNSSLDEATALRLMQNLQQSRRESTIIFISHRPDVATFCDSILRL